MTGVVLCGGQSTRMGQDKGLLQAASGTWAQLAAEMLHTLQLPVIVSINAQQYASYGKLFQKPMLAVDDDALTIGGPLKGILSAHRQRPQEDLLILACDMRNMQLAVLKHLRTTYATKGAEAVVFCNGASVEPLCGVYSAVGLHKIYNQYQHGLLKKYSMQAVLPLLETFYLPLPGYWTDAFKNFNAADDLRAL